MNKYELYEWIQGTLHPTGIWARGYSMGDAEFDLKKSIRKFDKPVVIVITPMKHGEDRSNQ